MIESIVSPNLKIFFIEMSPFVHAQLCTSTVVFFTSKTVDRGEYFRDLKITAFVEKLLAKLTERFDFLACLDILDIKKIQYSYLQ